MISINIKTGEKDKLKTLDKVRGLNFHRVRNSGGQVKTAINVYGHVLFITDGGFLEWSSNPEEYTVIEEVDLEITVKSKGESK